MTNPLIAARDRFSDEYPEHRILLSGRGWGFRDAGLSGGDAPTLLLIPGTLGRGDIFWQQIEALSDRLRLIAVSYPSSGGVEDWAHDMVGLMDRLRIASASILGSSLGGYLAQWIAAIAPHRVDRLIAANTLADATGLDRQAPYKLDLARAPIEELRAGFASGLCAWKTAHPEQANLVELLLQEAGGRVLEPELRARLLALKLAGPLPKAAFPAERAFSIEADDDPLIGPATRQGLRARLNPAVAYRFLSGGHFPYLARADAYTGLLEQIMGLDPRHADWGAGEERAL